MRYPGRVERSHRQQEGDPPHTLLGTQHAVEVAVDHRLALLGLVDGQLDRKVIAGQGFVPLVLVGFGGSIRHCPSSSGTSGTAASGSVGGEQFWAVRSTVAARAASVRGAAAHIEAMTRFDHQPATVPVCHSCLSSACWSGEDCCPAAEHGAVAEVDQRHVVHDGDVCGPVLTL